MTPITDPNLIAQLEGSPASQGMGAPITDPNLIAQLEGTGSPQQVNPSFMSSLMAGFRPSNLANSGVVQAINRTGNAIPGVLMNSILGAGDAIRNTPGNAINAISSFAGYPANIPTPTYGSGSAYNVGNFAGNAAAFMGGGEALDAARGAAEGLPLVGQAASALGGSNFLPGLARRVIGTGVYGAATNPSDPTTGAAEGVGMSVGGDLIPGAASLIGKAAPYIRPQQYAEQMMNTLGGGKSLEDNAQSLAQDIQNAYQQRKWEASALYSPIFDSLGNNSIYDGLNPALNSYPNVGNSILQDITKDRNINALHQEFAANPTLQNAHNLQSQLGTSIRKLQANDNRGNLSVADRGVLQAQQTAQGAVQNDINTFLTSKNPQLANQYNIANQNYAANVVPYIENPKIASIAKGDVTNPRNIATIFKNPEPETQQVVNDIGEPANQKILYSQLGKLQSNLTPERLQQGFAGLDKAGLSSYMTPNLSDQLNMLSTRINNRNYAQSGAGLLLGGALGHASGLPFAETGGAGAGALASRAAMRGIQKALPINSIANFLSNTTPAAYHIARNATLANTLNGGQ